jgi:hypothetical protein
MTLRFACVLSSGCPVSSASPKLLMVRGPLLVEASPSFSNTGASAIIFEGVLLRKNYIIGDLRRNGIAKWNANDATTAIVGAPV